MYMLGDVQTAEFGRRKGSKDKQKRKRRGLLAGAASIGGGAGIGAGIQALRNRDGALGSVYRSSMFKAEKRRLRDQLEWLNSSDDPANNILQIGDKSLDLEGRIKQSKALSLDQMDDIRLMSNKQIKKEVERTKSFANDRRLRKYENFAKKVGRKRLAVATLAGAGIGAAGYGAYRGAKALQNRRRAK